MLKISMEVTPKIISEVVGELLGEKAAEIALYLKNRNYVSELKVAEDFNIELQLARTILYKLYELNLARFERKKDRQKGWYITYWDFLPNNIMSHYKKLRKEKIRKLEERLKKEQNNQFYMCKNACVRLDFDSAFNLNFKCPECSSLLNPMDNNRTIEFLRERIKELKKNS